MSGFNQRMSFVKGQDVKKVDVAISGGLKIHQRYCLRVEGVVIGLYFPADKML